MFISQVVIKDRKIMSRSYSDANFLHQFVMSLFEDGLGEAPREKNNILWHRMSSAVHPHLVVIVQSELLPSIENIKSAIVREAVTVQTKEVDELYKRLVVPEGIISYKVRINPVAKQARSSSRRPITDLDKIEEWWANRLRAMGATAIDNATQVTRESVTNAVRNGKSVPLNTVTVVGLAQIEDAEKVLQNVKNGVGKEKAFGFGLVLLGSAS